MHNRLIKKRFRIVKMLTVNSAVVFIVLLIKYGLEVYRILVADHVGMVADMG